MYRSRDKDFMNSIKKQVLEATKGQEKEDRKFAVDYLKTHVLIDDLYQLAVKKFPGKEFEFGQGSYHPKVVVLTKDPISQEHMTKLTAAWRKLKLEDSDVFYTHVRFVKTKKKQDIRKDIIEKLISMLSPDLLVTFDDVDVSFKGKQYQVQSPITILTNVDEREKRRELTTQLRDYKKHSIF